jgi:hypothetical protein
MEWNKTYGGQGAERAYSLVATSDGGYAIAGSTRPSGGGNTSFWLVKTDGFGNMQWNKTYDSGTAYSLVATSDGGYAMAGSSMWVKTDALGNMEWNKTYGELSYGTFSIVTTSDSGYAIAGTTLGGDFWLIKANSLGNTQWNRTYNGTGYCWAHSLVTTFDGGYALAGTFDDLGPFSVGIGGSWLDGIYALQDAGDYPSSPQPNFWLVKTSAAGNMQWNKTYGGTGNDVANSLVAAWDGGYVLAGSTYSSDVGGDFWVMKTDSFGNMQWNRTYGGAGYEAAQSLVQTPDGGYALVGGTTSFGNGDSDFWLIKTDSVGVVPEFSSWLIPTLVLTAMLPILFRKKELLNRRLREV